MPGRSTRSLGSIKTSMALAPEPILRAGSEVVYLACIHCRANALEGSTSREMVAELMDAIHDLPHALVNWEPHHSAEYIRNHLGCFDARKWPGMPDLVATFNAKLREYGHDAA